MLFSEICFAPKLVHTFYVFNADIKKLCSYVFKTNDKYSQALLSWRKGSVIFYREGAFGNFQVL